MTALTSPASHDVDIDEIPSFLNGIACVFDKKNNPDDLARLADDYLAGRSCAFAIAYTSQRDQIAALEARVAELEAERLMLGDEGPLEWRPNKGFGANAWFEGVSYSIAPHHRADRDDQRWTLEAGTEVKIYPTKRLAKIAGQNHARETLSKGQTL